MINVNITKPEGVILATEKTIVNENIQVTIDESLLNQGGDGEDRYDEGFADGQESITKNIEIIERTVTGNGAIKLIDVSEVPHKIQVQVNLDGIEDPSAVKVRTIEKNLCDNIFRSGAISESNGTAGFSTSQICSVNYCIIKPNTTYTMSKCGIDAAVRFRFYDENKTYIGYKVGAVGVGTLTKTFTSAEDAYYVKFDIVSSKINDVIILLEEKDTASVLPEYVADENGYVSINSASPSMIILANVPMTVTYQKSYGEYRMVRSLNDAIQENGARTSYTSTYAYWPTNMFYPKYDINPTYAYGLFYPFGKYDEPIDLVERLTECGVSFDVSQATNLDHLFREARIYHIPEIDTRNIAKLTWMFYNNQNMHGGQTIDKLILKDDGSQTFTQVFGYNRALENITIEGVIGQNGFDTQHCLKLSKASIESIVNALSTTTSGLTVTFSLTAIKKAFETSTGAADGNTSDEWKTLTATRSNWTFSLV